MNFLDEPSSLSLTSSIEAMPIIGIGLEEHISFPHLISRLPSRFRTDTHALDKRNVPSALLFENGPTRLEAMDESCTAIQILSYGQAGADKMTGAKAIDFARDMNNAISDSIKQSANPDRFRAFAHLPTSEVKASIDEMHRCRTKLNFVGILMVGMQQNKFLDSSEFAPVLEAAETLAMPIYLHPGNPPEAVRQAYHYSTEHLDAHAAFMLSTAGYSWHSEVGLHVLRLCYSGVFDRHPRLQIIIGHNGELLSSMFARSDQIAAKLGLQKPISKILQDHVWVTLSGIFSLPPLETAIKTFGIDHICYSVDYPYVMEAISQAKFFQKAMRDTMSDRDVHKLMHGNAQKLLKI